MRRSVRFALKGPPPVAARPRAFRVCRKDGSEAMVLTSKKSGSQKSLRAVVQEIAREDGFLPLEGPLRVAVQARFQAPKSLSKKARLGLPVFKDTRPDIDNVAKAVLDAVSGVLFRDDGQVAELVVAKYIDGTAGMEVEIEEVNGRD